MNQPKLFLSLLVCLTLVAGASIARAQTDDKLRATSNYQITLQVLVGSNDASGNTELPANLSNISKQLHSSFSFSGYRLANTFLGRVGNNGSLEYESASSVVGEDGHPDAMTFMDWSVRDLRTMQNGFQAESFRFGAKVPVSVNAPNEAGKPGPVTYEPIGLKFDIIGLPENVPTLLGTLSLPRTSGTLFLVMTVTSADH